MLDDMKRNETEKKSSSAIAALDDLLAVTIQGRPLDGTSMVFDGMAFVIPNAWINAP